METLCHACTGGPAGIEGHHDLRAQSLGAHGITFGCRTCRAVWSRTYSTDGTYFWLRRTILAADVGMSLPSLTVPRTPANALMNSTSDAADHWIAIQKSWKQPRRHPA